MNGILVLAVLSMLSCGGPAPLPKPSTPPARSASPVPRDIEGGIVDNDQRPLAAKLNVFLNEGSQYGSMTATTDEQGRFRFKRVSPGRHLLSVKIAGEDLYLRPASDLARLGATTHLSVEVTQGSGPFDAGVVLAETYKAKQQRVMKLFVPYCTRARAGQRVDVPAALVPLALQKAGSLPWGQDFVDIPAEVDVKLMCTQKTMTKVGEYDGKPAYDMRWDVVVVLAGGIRRKSFDAPAPPTALSDQQGVDTGQEAQFKRELRQWLSEAGGPAPTPRPRESKASSR